MKHFISTLSTAPRRLFTTLPLVAALLLSACAVAPVRPPPPVVAPAQFKEAQDTAATVAPVPEAWWTLFNDPVLNDLENRLVLGNEPLKSSLAAVASARAAYEASRSALAPSLNVGSSVNDKKKFQFSTTATWEVDVWGRLSQASSGAKSTLRASSADLAAARLSAQALLAQTYFAMRTADAQGAVLARSLQTYQRALDLTQARYSSGVAARTDVLQAQTQLRNVQVQQADTRAQRAQLENALAVLVGQAPATFDIASRDQLPAVPEVPALLPSTLLQRRPDIAAAQNRLEAAYAQIGEARAAHFPTLTLSGGGLSRLATLGTLVSAPHLAWSLGASVAEAVLDGGKRQQASAQALAATQQAEASYRQTVLTSLQEVEDNLALAHELRQEAQWQAEALQSAQRALDITLDQYRGGTVGYLNVTAAQAAALGSESNLLAVRNRQLAAANQLLKNIAGRWAGEAPTSAPIPASAGANGNLKN